MNLRKIIREELDDMGWIKGVPTNPLTMYQYVVIWFDREIKINDLDILTSWSHEIHGTTDFVKEGYFDNFVKGGYIRFDVDRDDDTPDFGYGSSKQTFFDIISNPGEYVEYNLSELIPLNINESEDNLDWIKNTNPYHRNPDVGDIIEVHNMGDEREYLDWLGSYRKFYREGQFGGIITGEVVEHLNFNRILLQEQNTGLKIIFPPYEEMENKRLKLLYILK